MSSIASGPVHIDLHTRVVSVDGCGIEGLSKIEFKLLVKLAGEPTRVFSKEELLLDVWGYTTPSRTVDSYASRLRSKLCAGGSRLVVNVWGVGYRLFDVATAA